MKRAVTEEQINLRKEEIINEVSKMFDTIDYKDISMKTISERISIARSSLYCYYKSKEEIMLDIIKKDYLNFINLLTNTVRKKEDIAKNVCEIYLNHTKLLHIISTYLNDIETHVSLDTLIDFKTNFTKPFKELEDAFYETYSNVDKKDIRTIIDAMFMLTHGLYPMIYPSEVQIKANLAANIHYSLDKYQYCYNYLKLIFSKLE